MMTPMMTRKNSISRLPLRLLTVYFPVLVVLVLILFPFFWMLVTSFKANAELTDIKINPFYPHMPTLDHYRRLLTQTAYLHWFWNTTYVAVCSTAISMISIIAICASVQAKTWSVWIRSEACLSL